MMRGGSPIVSSGQPRDCGRASGCLGPAADLAGVGRRLVRSDADLDASA